MKEEKERKKGGKYWIRRIKIKKRVMGGIYINKQEVINRKGRKMLKRNRGEERCKRFLFPTDSYTRSARSPLIRSDIPPS
jgi:hypothetical protein